MGKSKIIRVMIVFIALSLPALTCSADSIDEPTKFGSLVVVPAGHFELDRPDQLGGQGTLVLPGAIFEGSVFPTGATDGSALSGNFGLALLFASTGAHTSGSLHTSLAIGPTTESGNYEKMGIYSRVTTSDASTYGKISSNRDAVGVEAQCSYGASILTGRCWAFDAITNVPRGTDGYAIGAEILIANRGSDQPRINDPTSKIGLHLVAGGDAASTAGIVLSAVKGAAWHDALVVKRSAVTGYAMVVRDDVVGTLDPIAAIGINGDAAFREVTLSGSLRRMAMQRDVPATGGRVSIQSSTETEILAPLTRIESANVALPIGKSGAGMRIVCVKRIAHLAVIAPGAVVHGLPDMPCDAGRGHEYAYYPSDGWIQVY